MSKKIASILNYLISLFILLSSTSFLWGVSIKGDSFRAELPRSLKTTKIKLKFTLQGIPSADISTQDVKTLAGMVKIFVPAIKNGIEVPDVENENSEIKLTRELSENDCKLEANEDSSYYELTLSFEIKETQADVINTAIKDTKKLAFTIQYKSKDSTTTDLTKDESGKLLEAIVPPPVIDAPDLTGASSGFRSVGVNWNLPDKVKLQDGSYTTPSDLSLIIIKKEEGKNTIDIPSKVYTPSNATDTPTTCTVDLRAPSGTICDNCLSNDSYYDLSTLPQGVTSLNVDNISKKSTTLGGLEISKEYVVLAQYGSTGLSRSKCFTATPYTNYSLSEFYEGTHAKQDDLNCFIATAAYGTSFSSELYILRWFRDTYLKSNTIGSKFVTLYYRYSPPVAKFISKHPMVASMVRGALFIPVKLCTLLLIMSPYVPNWLSFILVMMFLVLTGYGFSRLIRLVRR